MIPRAHITGWRPRAPWSTDAQIEQDLVICRALVEIYSDDLAAREVAFRGGTALHKLYFEMPGRYSEDIELVSGAFQIYRCRGPNFPASSGFAAIAGFGNYNRPLSELYFGPT
jgi:hypothetical protein